MPNKFTIEANVKQETIKRIDEIIKYGEFRKKYAPDFDFPSTAEDVMKAALHEYFHKIDVLYSNVIGDKLYKLKGNGTLRNKLRSVIKDAGYKQKDIADLTGIDQGALSNILSNRNQPSMDYFLRIWVVLGCPPIEHIFYRDSD